jgi:hypothetical protein
MSVPKIQPIKAYIRLMGVKATPKPNARFEIKSIFYFSRLNQ